MNMKEWKEERNALCKRFKFKDFSEAFAFMTRVALLAEKMGHHPTWTNTYDTVEVRLSTHDAGDVITEKDRKLAGRWTHCSSDHKCRKWKAPGGQLPTGAFKCVCSSLPHLHHIGLDLELGLLGLRIGDDGHGLGLGVLLLAWLVLHLGGSGTARSDGLLRVVGYRATA